MSPAFSSRTCTSASAPPPCLSRAHADNWTDGCAGTLIGESVPSGSRCTWSITILAPSKPRPHSPRKRGNRSLTELSWGNWQYQAGVGNDPRSSRQFNPIKQASDYDPEGEYVRLWIPELKDVPDKYLQTPWCEFSLYSAARVTWRQSRIDRATD